MPAKRPTPVLVLAILHFVFGGLGVTGGICGLAGSALSSAIPQDPQTMEMQRRMEARMGGKGVEIISQFVYLIIGGMILTAGFGLLNMAPWGRTLAQLTAYCTIAYIIFTIGFTVLVSGPAIQEVFDEMMQQPEIQDIPAQNRQPLEMVAHMTKAAVYGSACFYVALLAFPISVLVILHKQHVVAAFAGEASPMDDIPDIY